MAWLRKLLPWFFVILIWDASPSETVTGYKIYYTDHVDTYIVDVGDVLTTEIDVRFGIDWYFYATAYDAAGNESVPSNTVDTKPKKPTLWHEVR